MTTGLVTLEYGYNSNDKATLRQWFECGDTSSKVGPGGVIDMTEVYLNPADHQPMLGMGDFLANFLVCLMESCENSVRPLYILAEQYADTPLWPKTVINSATYTVANFTPDISNIARRGPRGKPFIGGKQTVAGTNKTGWLRWHYLSGKFAALPDTFAANQISAVFASYYSNLAKFATNGLGYGTLTNAFATYPIVVDKSIPSTILFYGTRNG